MSNPVNDPKLWTLEGIGDVLDEMSGELGYSVEYGWVCLGRVYRRIRETTPQDKLRDARTDPGVLELWATIVVDETVVSEFLIADAEKELKPGTRFEIRKKIPTNYGRTHGMAWYRNEAMGKRETWGSKPKVPERRDGYLLVGEYTTPAVE